MTRHRVLVALAAAPVLAVVSALAVPASAAPTETLHQVAATMHEKVVTEVPGYDGPTIDADAVTAAIDGGSAKIRVVELPSSVVGSTDPARVPTLLKQESGFLGNVAVLTKKGFYATNGTAAKDALAAEKQPNAVVLAYIRETQGGTGSDSGGVATTTTAPSSTGLPIGGIIVFFVLAAMAIAVLRRAIRRRGTAVGPGRSAGPDLESMRRRSQADLEVLQAEYNDHTGTDGGVQGTIDAASQLITTGATAADFDQAGRMIAAARNQLNPGRAPIAPVGYSAAGHDDPDTTYAVDRSGSVQRYSGALPAGYAVLPPQYYGATVGGNLTNTLLLAELFGGGFGGFGGGNYGGGFENGYDRGFQNGVQADTNNGGGGGDWGGGGSGGGDWGGGGGGGDWGGGGGGGGGGDSSGGGNW